MESKKEYSFSIRGEVEIKDLNTNKIVVKKHNMIVKNGRDYIKSLFMARNSDLFGSSIGGTLESLSNSKLEYVKFGGYTSTNPSTSAATTPQTTLGMTDLSNPLDNYEYMLSSSNSNSEGNSSNATVTLDTERIKITIKQTSAKNNTPVLINELGIFLNGGSMFSRVSFDGIYLDTTTSFEINYYIYF